MYGIFGAATAATAGAVTYGVSLLSLVLDMLPIDFTAPRNESRRWMTSHLAPTSHPIRPSHARQGPPLTDDFYRQPSPVAE